ncbi:16S rRNA (cytidine(1402)-2'-O)-methyltransferase [Cerasicoccus arenae]|uniref:Ribosomal RNA small subunit methyltransferase I n=1 Tax=Cerasicoccus arenae TaxID=424488 RepID=A0A8J3DFL1_9BACT|nr:16S rRNA (cytidine(1402)-2'-O)-methyltransferase [Cerasicoccus arenae]MBK1857532.1 16S rRNA (cytidine(1402)-2'-O)-methyltransferase [Cerasicoccus arenae]GHB95558.1 ribosomal RNA small subunit methyltransferase I [Cerasicoccus arenae]
MDDSAAEKLESALYVVSTPIGNLGDLSARAVDVLCRADVIACEDTRTTGRLLGHIGSKRPAISYHEHNELARATELADKITDGQSVALVSDAGTPTLSDPGFRVVRECRRRSLTVVPVPGASALLAALAASGLPTDAFFYAGFLPPKSAARRTFLERHRDFPHTLVVYESCHRITKFLAEMLDVLGPDRVICLSREITKKFESIQTAPLKDLASDPSKISIKGEFVVLIATEGFVL